MLAGDVATSAPSPYWNYVNPTDVNNDGNESTIDLLILVNTLTRTGARRLDAAPAAASGAEGEAGTSTSELLYVDTNNDGMLNALDLLKVMNELGPEGEDPLTLVRFSLIPVAHGTNTPLTQI